MSFAVQQAVAFCDLNHFTFKLKYEKCFKKFACAFYRVTEVPTEKTVNMGGVDVLIVIDQEDKVAVFESNDYEKAILGALRLVSELRFVSSETNLRRD